MTIILQPTNFATVDAKLICSKTALINGALVATNNGCRQKLVAAAVALPGKLLSKEIQKSTQTNIQANTQTVINEFNETVQCKSVQVKGAISVCSLIRNNSVNPTIQKQIIRAKSSFKSASRIL